ncbi:MAG: response regulator transcription factor [Nitrospirae bacterium]|nr:response regulator transcription factor [Nitrospirota bacterium]
MRSTTATANYSLGPERRMTGEEILIIEDDPDVAGLLKAELVKHHYRARVASDGLTGMAEAQRQPPALIVLDLMLPVLNGWEVCRSLKRHPKTRSVPLLILTALTTEEERVKGLELGADDYLTKPFSLKELMARMRALLRRDRLVDQEKGSLTVAGPLIIDSDRHEAKMAGRLLKLTPIEFALLTCLATQPGKVFTRDQLISLLWGEDRFVEEHNLDVHIHAVRQQLEPDAVRPSVLLTVRGVGYKLQPQGKPR